MLPLGVGIPPIKECVMYADKINRVARTVNQELVESPDNQGIVGIWEKGNPDHEIGSYICEDCCHRFEAEDPSECPVCGSLELAED